MLIPTNRTVAAILTVMNEEKSLPDIIKHLHRLPLDEIIIVVNGSGDGSFQKKARELSHATIVYYPAPLGYDVGRAVGAMVSSAEILLFFLDGDFTVKAEKLVPFIHAIEKGNDLALNDIRPYVGLFFKEIDTITLMKQFLNRTLGRSELGSNSLTAVPHALSRKAYELLGPQALTVPPKAMVIAIEEGLKKIDAPASVNVIRKKNKVKEHNHGSKKTRWPTSS